MEQSINTEFQLMLYPVESDFEVDLEKLKDYLVSLGVVGKRLSDYGLQTDKAGDYYAVGDEFLSHFTFMGCSPDIELEPQKDKAFCYIILDSFLQAQFVAGDNLKKARCTSCKKALKKISNSLCCPRCEEPLQLDKINWRKSAFIAKVWLSIGNIYELEAIPNDELLDSLKHLTDVQWKPAYVRNAIYRELN